MHGATDVIVQEFLKHGLAGVVALIAIYGFWKKDRENKSLYDAVLEREAKHNERYQALVREVDATLDIAVGAIQRRER